MQFVPEGTDVCRVERLAHDGVPVDHGFSDGGADMVCSATAASIRVTHWNVVDPSVIPCVSYGAAFSPRKPCVALGSHPYIMTGTCVPWLCVYLLTEAA